MTGAWWSHPTDPDTVRRRAAGRSHYNTWRRDVAAVRQGEVVKLLMEQPLRYGRQRELAKQLGVSEATISRDIRAVLYKYQCPMCLTPHPRAHWKKMERAGRVALDYLGLPC